MDCKGISQFLELALNAEVGKDRAQFRLGGIKLSVFVCFGTVRQNLNPRPKTLDAR